MGSLVNEAALNRVTSWLFYYLGVIDGMSRSLETIKLSNPELVNDLEWQGKLRACLPSELAALRQPDAYGEAATRIIEQEFTRALEGQSSYKVGIRG